MSSTADPIAAAAAVTDKPAPPPLNTAEVTGLPTPDPSTTGSQPKKKKKKKKKAKKAAGASDALVEEEEDQDPLSPSAVEESKTPNTDLPPTPVSPGMSSSGFLPMAEDVSTTTPPAEPEEPIAPMEVETKDEGAGALGAAAKAEIEAEEEAKEEARQSEPATIEEPIEKSAGAEPTPLVPTETPKEDTEVQVPKATEESAPQPDAEAPVIEEPEKAAGPLKGSVSAEDVTAAPEPPTKDVEESAPGIPESTIEVAPPAESTQPSEPAPGAASETIANDVPEKTEEPPKADTLVEDTAAIEETAAPKEEAIVVGEPARGASAPAEPETFAGQADKVVEVEHTEQAPEKSGPTATVETSEPAPPEAPKEPESIPETDSEPAKDTTVEEPKIEEPAAEEPVKESTVLLSKTEPVEEPVAENPVEDPAAPVEELKQEVALEPEASGAPKEPLSLIPEASKAPEGEPVAEKMKPEMIMEQTSVPLSLAPEVSEAPKVPEQEQVEAEIAVEAPTLESVSAAQPDTAEKQEIAAEPEAAETAPKTEIVSEPEVAAQPEAVSEPEPATNTESDATTQPAAPGEPEVTVELEATSKSEAASEPEVSSCQDTAAEPGTTPIPSAIVEKPPVDEPAPPAAEPEPSVDKPVPPTDESAAPEAVVAESNLEEAGESSKAPVERDDDEPVLVEHYDAKPEDVAAAEAAVVPPPVPEPEKTGLEGIVQVEETTSIAAEPVLPEEPAPVEETRATKEPVTTDEAKVEDAPLSEAKAVEGPTVADKLESSKTEDLAPKELVATDEPTAEEAAVEPTLALEETKEPEAAPVKELDTVGDFSVADKPKTEEPKSEDSIKTAEESTSISQEPVQVAEEVKVDPLPAGDNIPLKTGEPIPRDEAHAESIREHVKLDKEAYESTEPTVAPKELGTDAQEEVKVDPLPAGDNAPKEEAHGESVQDHVKLDKEAYESNEPTVAPKELIEEAQQEVRVEPLPATENAENPVQVDPGQPVLDVHTGTINDHVKLDQEFYERTEPAVPIKIASAAELERKSDTPIAQVSETAAEVADVAAMLDAPTSSTPEPLIEETAPKDVPNTLPEAPVAESEHTRAAPELAVDTEHLNGSHITPGAVMAVEQHSPTTEVVDESTAHRKPGEEMVTEPAPQRTPSSVHGEFVSREVAAKAAAEAKAHENDSPPTVIVSPTGENAAGSNDTPRNVEIVEPTPEEPTPQGVRKRKGPQEQDRPYSSGSDVVSSKHHRSIMRSFWDVFIFSWLGGVGRFIGGLFGGGKKKSTASSR